MWKGKVTENQPAGTNNHWEKIFGLSVH